MEEFELIESLKHKIEQVFELYQNEKLQNEQLIQKINKNKEVIELKNKEIAELKHQLNTNKLANAFVSSSEETKEAKQKINAIVREIDNCIALLNR